VLKEKKAYNALDACKHLGLDEAGLDVEWKKSEAAGKLVKLGGGFYCGARERGRTRAQQWHEYGALWARRCRACVGSCERRANPARSRRRSSAP
jgi:hypothetical protein